MQKDAIGPGKRVVIAPEQPRARNLTIFNQESSIHSIMVIEELLQLIRKQEVMPLSGIAKRRRVRLRL
jgi:hypothetical protein